MRGQGRRACFPVGLGLGVVGLTGPSTTLDSLPAIWVYRAERPERLVTSSPRQPAVGSVKLNMLNQSIRGFAKEARP